MQEHPIKAVEQESAHSPTATPAQLSAVFSNVQLSHVLNSSDDGVDSIGFAISQTGGFLPLHNYLYPNGAYQSTSPHLQTQRIGGPIPLSSSCSPAQQTSHHAGLQRCFAACQLFGMPHSLGERPKG